MKISKDCNEKLENAEKRITILLNTEDGEIKEENFIPNDGE
jgi:exonuclease VII small subunit